MSPGPKPSWLTFLLSWLVFLSSWLAFLPSWLLFRLSWLTFLLSGLVFLSSWLVFLPSWLLFRLSWLVFFVGWLIQNARGLGLAPPCAAECVGMYAVSIWNSMDSPWCFLFVSFLTNMIIPEFLVR